MQLEQRLSTMTKAEQRAHVKAVAIAREEPVAEQPEQPVSPTIQETDVEPSTDSPEE